MSVRLRNLTPILQTITVVRPTQTYSKSADPLAYLLLSDDEYAFINPPLVEDVWEVEFNPPEVEVLPPPVAPDLFTTDGLPEGSLHLYFTDERARAAFREGMAVATFTLLEAGASPFYSTTFQGADQSADITYTLPNSQGAAETFLKNDGTGILSWSVVPNPTVSLQDAYFEGSAIATSSGYGSLQITGTEGVQITAAGGLSTLSLGILEGGAVPTFYTYFQGSDQSGNITYKLPPAQGAAATVLTNDGLGNLTWEPASAVDLSVQNSVGDCGAAEVGAFADGNGTVPTGGLTAEAFLLAVDANLKGFEDDIAAPSGAALVGIDGTGSNYLGSETNVQEALSALDAQIAAGSLGPAALQDTYETGNTITTSAGEGSVEIGGTESFKISATGGLDLTNKPIRTTSLNQGISIVPNGTGYLAAAVPDNTVTGGNTRGLNSVDLQTARSASAQVASGNYATMSGGANNKANSDYTTVSGGTNNTASQAKATVGGGESNTASGTFATVSGGISNTASGSHSAIGGGSSNTASGADATVAGGIGNSAGAAQAVVSGGQDNTASGDFSSVAGGADGTASGQHSAVLGGRGNTAAHAKSLAGGGGALTSADFDFVLGQADTDTSALGNVHFKVSGADSIVHVGRMVDQSAIPGASNELRLHTTNASNQSSYIGHKASTIITGSSTYVWPRDGLSGQVLRTDGAGNLSWLTLSMSGMSIGGSVTGAVSGSVFFAAGAALGQDNGNLFWDNANKRLGIGTASPVAALSVGATNQFQVNSTGNIVKVNNLAVSFPSIQGGSGTVLTNDGAGNLSWTSSGGASQWLDNGSDIYFSTGRVGIGTNTPSHPLEVRGASAVNVPIIDMFATSTATFGRGIRCLGNLSAGQDFYYQIGHTEATSDSGQFGYHHVADGSFNNFMTIGLYNTDHVLTVNGHGRVAIGMGTNAPPSLLSVGSGATFQVDSSGNIVSVRGVTYSFPASQGAASTVLTNDGSGNLSWAAASGSSGSLQDAYDAGSTITTSGKNVTITGGAGSLSLTGGSGISVIGTGYLTASGGASGVHLGIFSKTADANPGVSALFANNNGPGPTATFRNLDPSGNSLRLGFANAGSNVDIAVDPTTSAYTIKLPLAQSSGTGVLANDGSGNLSWVSSSSPLTSTVVLSSSDINNLDTIPIELVPAPGAGEYILVESIESFYDFNTSAFSPSGKVTVMIGYTGSPSFINTPPSTLGLDGTADKRRLYKTSQNDFTLQLGTAVSVETDNALTGGDSTLTLRTSYRVVTAV